jgi:hypothetical protein
VKSRTCEKNGREPSRGHSWPVPVFDVLADHSAEMRQPRFVASNRGQSLHGAASLDMHAPAPVAPYSTSYGLVQRDGDGTGAPFPLSCNTASLSFLAASGRNRH